MMGDFRSSSPPPQQKPQTGGMSPSRNSSSTSLWAASSSHPQRMSSLGSLHSGSSAGAAWLQQQHHNLQQQQQPQQPFPDDGDRSQRPSAYSQLGPGMEGDRSQRHSISMFSGSTPPTSQYLPDTELANKLAEAEQEMRRKESENNRLRQELQLLQQRLNGEVDDGMPFSPKSARSSRTTPRRSLSSSPRRIANRQLARAISVDELGLGELALSGIARGDHSALSTTEGGSRRASTCTSPRLRRSMSIPGGTYVMLPYEVAKETLGEKYIVLHQQVLHVGSMNGLCGWGPDSICMSLTFRAKAKGSSSSRAVKMVRKERILFPKLLQRQYADFTAMEHPSLCRLWDAFEDTQNLYFVFDNMAGPSLLEQALEDSAFCERDAGAAGKVLLQALAHLHKHHIVHLNVRPENLRFMLTPKKKGWGSVYQDQLKLLDFGHCMHLKYLSSVVLHSGAEDAGLPPFPALGTDSHLFSGFCPPEHRGGSGDRGPFSMTFSDLMAKNVQRRGSIGGMGSGTPSHQASWASLTQDSLATSLSRQSSGNWNSVHEVKKAFKALEAGDVWAAGCVIHLLLAGAPPEGDGFNGMELPTLPQRTSQAARELCAALLQQHPSRRPTSSDAVDCAWFKQVEWLQKAHRSEMRSDMRTVELRQDHHAMLRPMVPEVKVQLALHHRAVQVRRALLRSRALLAASEAGKGKGAALAGLMGIGGHGSSIASAPAAPGVSVASLDGIDGPEGPSVASHAATSTQRQASTGRLSIASSAGAAARGATVAVASDKAAGAPSPQGAVQSNTLLPVPPVIDNVVANQMTLSQAVELICQDAFKSVMQVSQSKKTPKCLTLAELQSILAHVGDLPGQNPMGVLKRLSPAWKSGNVTGENFHDLVTDCVATHVPKRRHSPSVAAGQRLAMRGSGSGSEPRRGVV